MMNLNDKRLGAYRSASNKTDQQAKDDGKRIDSEEKSKKPSSVELPGLIKVATSQDSHGKENPYRKVAKFLILIGVDEAAKVVSRLSPEQTERVALELASIRRVDSDEATVVLAEFESLLRKAREPTGGIDTARSILTQAFGEERADSLLHKAVPFIQGKPFDYLEDVDEDRIYRLITDELPAVKALVLSQMKSKKAAQVINLMGDSEKKETIIRLAKLTGIAPDTVARVDAAMREKIETIDTASSDSIDGRFALAEILRRMDGKGERSILDALSHNDQDLARDIRDRLFTLDDIVRADDKFLQEHLRSLGERDIALILAGKSEEIRTKILSAVSKTRGAMILEEEKIIHPVSRQEADTATSVFFLSMRKAWEEGKLFISGRDDRDKWV